MYLCDVSLYTKLVLKTPDKLSENSKLSNTPELD